jgi:hypothetical protein
VKYLLITQMNPDIWRELSEAQRTAVLEGRRKFQQLVVEAGELISAHTLADPSQSSVVTIENGMRLVTEGPFLDTTTFPTGYVLVDCDDKQRAHELAALIPDAAIKGLAVEVRPIMHSAGTEM